jgi:CRP-like cAMP-binding protein
MTVSDGAKPPLQCADCLVGPYALYGPTMKASPHEIDIRRRQILSFNAQKTFLHEGQPLTQSFTLYSGWAFNFRQFGDGRRQILSFLLPGDQVVFEGLFFPNRPAPYSVKSLTAVSLCVFSISDMIGLTKATDAQIEHLSGAAWKHADAASRRMMDLGHRSAIGRVSQILVDIERRLAERGGVQDNQFHFPVRQDHLADALGLTSVYVNRTLDRLRKDGIIEFERDRMKIMDPETLRKIADEE